MKIIEKNSPMTRPRIVALVNRPLTQYRMRVPMVPSGPGTLSVWSAPRRIRHLSETLDVSHCHNFSVVDDRNPPRMRLSNIQVVSRQDRGNTSLSLTADPVLH